MATRKQANKQHEHQHPKYSGISKDEDFREVQDVERALERQGRLKHYDYREELCACQDGEEDW